MRFSIFAVMAVVCVASPSFAQTEGRVSVGASVTLNATTDDEVGSAFLPGPLVRLNPHKGWGPAAGLNWFRADLLNPAGGEDDFARLRIRPLMAGVSYTVGTDTVLTSFAIVAGPSFNRAKFDGDYVPAAGESIHADTSLAVRPGVGVTWTVAPRVAIVGFGGYLINRPDVVYRNAAGQEVSDRWKADSVVLSIGAVYSLF
jgi:hypothetical protein